MAHLTSYDVNLANITKEKPADVVGLFEEAILNLANQTKLVEETISSFQVFNLIKDYALVRFSSNSYKTIGGLFCFY